MDDLNFGPLIELAKKVLNKGKFNSFAGLCHHFNLILDEEDDIYSYKVYEFYGKFVPCKTYLGPPGELTPDRIEFLDWIINDLPNLKDEYYNFLRYNGVSHEL
jgi:hypothetical protein